MAQLQLPASAFEIKDVLKIVESNDKSLHASFTYLCVKARAQPTVDDVEMYLDLGVSCSIISLSFFNTLDYAIERRYRKICGISKSTTNKWATFTIFLPSVD